MNFGETANGNGKAIKNDLSSIPASFVKDISEVNFNQVQTPSFLFFEKTASELFARAEKLAKNLSIDEIEVTNPYSMKTNPDARLIQLAHEAGFLAEAISPLEVKLWDGSAGWWINPKQLSGCSRLRAIRLFASDSDKTEFKWGEHRIAPNQWQEIV